MERKVLGKGLDVLIPKKLTTPTIAEKEFTYLPINKIQTGRFQPRQTISEKELQELSLSIKEKGFIQPIVVRRANQDTYEIVAGGRRYLAAKALGINEIPVIIKELNDRDALILAITENLQRQDLNPIEEAEAFKRLIEEFNFSYEEIAKFLGKDKTTIINTLRLLNLSGEIKEALGKGLITRTQARTLLAIEDTRAQRQLFEEILKERLSVREIERKVKRLNPKKRGDPFVNEVEERLQKLLGTKVRIFNKRNNRGRIIIEYYSIDDLEKILKKLEG